jgi:hypothetical protein
MMSHVILVVAKNAYKQVKEDLTKKLKKELSVKQILKKLKMTVPGPVPLEQNV